MGLIFLPISEPLKHAGEYGGSELPPILTDFCLLTLPCPVDVSLCMAVTEPHRAHPHSNGVFPSEFRASVLGVYAGNIGALLHKST